MEKPLNSTNARNRLILSEVRQAESFNKAQETKKMWMEHKRLKEEEEQQTRPEHRKKRRRRSDDDYDYDNHDAVHRDAVHRDAVERQEYRNSSQACSMREQRGGKPLLGCQSRCMRTTQSYQAQSHHTMQSHNRLLRCDDSDSDSFIANELAEIRTNNQSEVGHRRAIDDASKFSRGRSDDCRRTKEGRDDNRSREANKRKKKKQTRGEAADGDECNSDDSYRSDDSTKHVGGVNEGMRNGRRSTTMGECSSSGQHEQSSSHKEKEKKLKRRHDKDGKGSESHCSDKHDDMKDKWEKEKRKERKRKERLMRQRDDDQWRPDLYYTEVKQEACPFFRMIDVLNSSPSQPEQQLTLIDESRHKRKKKRLK